MKSSVSYKATIVMASLVCVASLGAMEPEQPTSNLITSQEIKDFTQSIMMVAEESDSSLKPWGWFSEFSDRCSNWWHGLDTNVASELQAGTLTKDIIVQDKKLQKRAYDAISVAIEKKRTENLCVLLNQLHKFEMLACVAEQKEPITQFLNAQIPLVCEQKASAKLMNILTTMKTMQFTVDSNLLVVVNKVLNEQKERDIQTFGKIYEETHCLAVNILERLEKYKNPLGEAKNIVLMQKYLGGEYLEIGPKQMKEELGLVEDDKPLTALLKALTLFVDKK